MKHVGHNVNHPYIIQKPYQLHFDKVWKVGILGNAYDCFPKLSLSVNPFVKI